MARRQITPGSFVFTSVVAATLFLGALGVRVFYQQVSVVNNPVRADAGRYVSAAYNLRVFGVYSTRPPRRDSGAPTTGSDQPPGYPLFLSAFVSDPFAVIPFAHRVSRAQAVLGASSSVLTFLLARSVLTLPWAVGAGVLVACNPHLIAADQYLLTESLFVFLLLSGSLLFTWSWRRGNNFGIFAASVLLAASAPVRLVSLFLLPSLAPLLLLAPGSGSLTLSRAWARPLFSLVLGCLVVFGAYRTFVRGTLPVSSGAPVIEARYPQVRSPLGYLAHTVRPPRFYVAGESHVLLDHPSRDYKLPTEKSFVEAPVSYLWWNLTGRLKVMWHWENAYNGDVDIYPMLRRGFDESVLLGATHRIVRVLHWPLFLLSLAAPVLLVARWRSGRRGEADVAILVPMLGFLYLLLILSFLSSWLPRYTLPARPFSYILAMATLCWLTERRRSWMVPRQDVGRSSAGPLRRIRRNTRRRRQARQSA